MSSSSYAHTLARPTRPRITLSRVAAYAPGWGAIVFLCAHLLLGIAIHQFKILATFHAIGTLLVGLAWAATGNRRHLDRVAYVCAYIVGAEVLWRMAEARVFWEVGKYGIAVIFIVATIRCRLFKGPALPLLYFALLLPSAAMIKFTTPYTWQFVRESISFNLSGHFALLASAWFFSHVKLSSGQLQRLFVALIGPVISVAAFTFFFAIEIRELSFGSESNFDTSGGFGPNQVSTMLGFGSLLALLCFLLSKGNFIFKASLFAAMTFMAVQSALTFSRSGLYTAAGAGLLAVFYLIKDARSRMTLVILVVLIFSVANLILLPRLETITSGRLSERFLDVNLTGRDRIIRSDFQLWLQNPILGTGPGLSKWVRQDLWGRSAHTEFSRLFAEHGVFGLVAFVLLLIMAGQMLFRRRGSYRGKAVATVGVAWSCLYMLSAALRLAAPSFAFGLAFASLMQEDNSNTKIPAIRKRSKRRLNQRMVDGRGPDVELANAGTQQKNHHPLVS